ncbi:MAG: protein-export chaperone SecB [Alphaproteobacteria bacterium]
MAKDKTPEKPPQKKPEQAGALPQAGTAPGIQVVAQYIKDFSFENPNAPESLVAGWPQPETNVQIFLRHQTLRDDAYECSVNFRVEAKKPGEDKVAFIVDLSYAALVLLKNVPKENHAPVIMVEVPKLLFPFAREIIANATASGGYPPLYLTPISFEQIYLNEMKRQQGTQAQVGGA